MKRRTENIMWLAVIAVLFGLGITDPIIWEWVSSNHMWILGVLLLLLVSNACTALVCTRKGYKEGYEFGYSEGKK